MIDVVATSRKTRRLPGVKIPHPVKEVGNHRELEVRSVVSPRRSDLFDQATEAAHVTCMYYAIIDRLGGPNPPSTDELVSVMVRLNVTCQNMASHKELEKSQTLIDQMLRVRHMQSLVPEHRRLQQPKFTHAPSEARLEEARARFLG